MKRIIALCLLLCLLLSCAACGVTAPEPTVAPTAAPTEPTAAPTEVPTEPPHVCQSICEVCGLCDNEACAEAVCAEKCIRVYGDFITTEPIRVDTGILVFDIGENIYVPANLEEMGVAVAAAIEKETGLDYASSALAKREFPDGKAHVIVTRDLLYEGQDWYTGLDTSEHGGGYARDVATVSPGDLFLAQSSTVVHELTHVLMFRQSDWYHEQTLTEGFAEYNAYVVICDLLETDPQKGYYLARPIQSLLDMSIWDYDKLFEQPVEYWLDNTFEYSGNANYAVGFRFMAYLHEVYGDYGKWIPAFEKRYPYSGGSDLSATDRRITVLKSVYGEDVFDNFYPWLKENMQKFDETQADAARDLTAVEEIAWYPRFDAIESSARMELLKYKDLRIDVKPMRKYVQEYKGFDGSNLQLVTSDPVEVILHYEDGTSATVMTGSETAETPILVPAWYNGTRVGGNMETRSVLSLEGVSAIQLVGEGQLDWMEVVGDFRVLDS